MYTPTPYFGNIPLRGLLALLAIWLALLPKHALEGL